MPFLPFLNLLRRNAALLIIGLFAGAAFGLAASFLVPLRYSSTARLLVTQANAAGLDPYTAVKSTEQVAVGMRELVYTSLFQSAVLQSIPEFNSEYFSADEYHRRKEWRETVEVGLTGGTGILTVVVFHPDRAQAELLVGGVANQLMEKTPSFFGNNARVQLIDTPLPSRWIAKPSFLQNTVFGGGMGLLCAVVIVLAIHSKKENG